MKTIKNLALTQKPAVFTDRESGKTIDYMQYSLTIGNREILVKPVNAEAKVRLTDIFGEIK